MGLLQPKDASKPAQPGGCAICHVGLGAKPSPVEKVNQSDFENIDCLLCHAPNYRRTVIKQGDRFKIAPASGVDILKAAQNVQKPTNEMCLRCHAFAGGGLNNKHGVTPTEKTDIHVSKGLVCVDCHTVKAHKIAGGADLKALELLDVKVDCSNCHTDSPHKGAQANNLNDHTRRITCQTCHIPAIARDQEMPTVVHRDWTKPVLNEKIGLYAPTNKFAANIKPEYRWWNRYMKVVPEPIGSIDDPKSKISPWKRGDYTISADAETGKGVYIKAGVYQITGDVSTAAKKGAEDASQPYSGNWKSLDETLYFSLNHQVVSKDMALQCNSCHSSSGIMDFKALGYKEEMVKKLTRNY